MIFCFSALTWPCVAGHSILAFHTKLTSDDAKGH